MKYADPLAVDCPNCKEVHKYPVRDLLDSRATCLTCHYYLDLVGEEMRGHIADWNYISYLFGFLNSLEDALDIQFEDKEIENIKSLDEVLNLVQAKSFTRNEKQLKRTIIETAANTGNYTVEQLAWGMDLREVFEKQ